MRTTSSLFALLLSAPALAQGGVHVVASDGSGDFLDLPQAVAAAASGDTLLVRDGTYSGFLALGKGLTVVADTGASPLLTGQVNATGLPADSALILDGLRVEPKEIAAFAAFQCDGTVWIEDCELAGGRNACGVAQPCYDPCQGARVFDCDDVVIVRSTLAGGEGAGGDAHGLEATFSAVHVYDSELVGFAFPFVSAGGNGAQLAASSLFASGTLFEGGKGGDGLIADGCSFGTGGPGGNALKLNDASAQLMGSALVVGAGGLGLAPCGDGEPGQEVLLLGGGTLAFLNELARSFAVGSPLREGQAAEIDYAGAAGDLVLGLFSLTASPLPSQELSGTLLPAQPPGVVTLGAADAQGELATSVPLGSLPAGFESLVVFLQGVAVSTGGAVVLAAGSELLLLDAAF
ncbi:MAG: hypothetical protein AAF682_06300 [Planctomycetota bacterium]